ncbi:MAG: hypothetical protein JO006_03680 [Paucibacter sp.]|nr:hypothetical protein [Roseateles sp.]
MSQLVRLLLLVVLVASGQGALAQPTIASTTTATAGNNAGSIAIGAPAGLAVNDVMVAVIAQNASSLPIVTSAPTGWTLLGSPVTGDSSLGMNVYTKVAASGDLSATFTWTLQGSKSRTSGLILAVRGANTSQPVNAQANQINNTASSSYTAPSVTTSTTNNLVLVMMAMPDGNGSINAATGMTKDLDVATAAGPNGVDLASMHATQASAGATGAWNSTGNSNSENIGYTVAIAAGAASTIDHYELSVPSNMVSCQTGTITVNACANSSSPCTSLATTVSGQTATLSTSAGSLAANTLTFNAAGTASTTLSYGNASNGATATESITATSAAANNADTCCIGGACSVSHSCAVTVNTAGFIVSSSSTGGATTVASQVAGTSSGTYYLRAIKTNTTTGACTAALSGATTVNLAYACNNPSTCSSGNLMSVNGGTPTAIPGNPASSVSSYASVNMTFDNVGNGSAPFTLNYSDVGQVTLYAQKLAGGALLTTLTGNSGPFVVAPASFGFSNVTASPVKAGNNFGATVTARTSTGATAPNFGREASPEGVTLFFTAYQPTGSGAVTGSFTGNVGSFASGVATSSNLNYSEVGKIDLNATLTSGSYLGSGLTANGSTGATGAVRLSPDHFTTQVTQGCASGGFTYSGQPFTLLITAWNGATTPAKTRNYDGSTTTTPNFAKAQTLSDAGNAGVGSFGGTASVAASAFSAGVATLTTPAYTFTTAKTVPTTITVRSTESIGGDGISSAGFTEGTVPLRSGSLVLRNAYGAELLPLPMKLEADYWAAGGYWAANGADSCTTLLSAGVTLDASSYQGNLSAGNTQFSPMGPYALASGHGTLTLSPPGTGHSGSVNVNINNATAGVPWFGTALEVGKATFGLRKASVVNRKEVY